MTYPLANPSIFRTIQGEGALLGVPMVFVRLAGCSIGCPQCDTDYRVDSRLTLDAISERVNLVGAGVPWSWVTGGEPADHDIGPLCELLRLRGKVAVATSGTKPLGRGTGLVDFLSVSPHGKPSDLVFAAGNQINLVPGLNGLNMRDWEGFDASGFTHRYVTPMDADAVAGCVGFLDRNPGWRLGVQAHKIWELP